MNYSKEEFFDLMTQAENQGAQHLDELCNDRVYEFGGRVKPLRLRGCLNSSLFEVPFGDNEGVVRVCAVDDDMGRWPRFGGDRFGIEQEADSA